MNGTTDRSGHAEEVTLQIVRDHAAELLRFARRFSLCADDAHDAYQRSIEILVRRMRSDPPDSPINWLRSVVRNESLRVRMEREQLLGRDEVDLDRQPCRTAEDPSERVEGFERLGRVAEALQRLKSQEVTALVLRAEGLSYAEICDRTGWTYTKCNRAITEGRRALRERLGAIESGAECERWLPLLSRLADGEATAAQVTELRPHLRTCSACRATLREYHDAPRAVAALVPVAAVPLVGGGDPAPLLRSFETLLHALVERATFAATRLQGAFDALPATKVAAVAASTAALAGSGVAIERATQPAPPTRTGAQTAAQAPSSGEVGGQIQLVSASLRQPASAGTATAFGTRGEFAVEGEARPPGEFVASRDTAQAASVRATAAAAAPVTRPVFSTHPARPTHDPPPNEFGGP